MSPFWHLEFGDGFQIFGKYGDPEVSRRRNFNNVNTKTCNRISSRANLSLNLIIYKGQKTELHDIPKLHFINDYQYQNQ